MKDIRNLTFYGNKSFTNVKGLLMNNGVKKFCNVHRNMTTLDDILVTITRFEFKWNGNLYFAICEPEMDIFEINTKPIKGIK